MITIFCGKKFAIFLGTNVMVNFLHNIVVHTLCKNCPFFGEHFKNNNIDPRSTFSPIFTSGKMKGMMVFLREISQRLTNELAKRVSVGWS
jgi:hypothetical protein